MRKRIYGLLLLALVPAHVRAEPILSADRLDRVLATIARGQDGTFGHDVAPALSLEAAAPAAERSSQIVMRIAHEIATVTAAFTGAPEHERIAKTKAAVAAFSPETARDGASRSFEGDGPALSVMRQVLFVPTKAAGADPVAKVVALVSQFEHSPKTDDTYYEYEDPTSLRRSPVSELPGSATSWTSNAQSSMTPGKLYALKKCRHIVVLGWYCNTQLYQVRDLPGSDGSVSLLLTFLRPLAKGADNARFTDARAENLVDGYTAAYVVTKAGNMVLVYNLGIQSSATAARQQAMLNRGQKQEYAQLERRIADALGLRQLPF